MMYNTSRLEIAACAHTTGRREGVIDVSLSEDIKDFALAIGYDRVGIATTEDFSFYREQLEGRRGLYDGFGDLSASCRLSSGASIVVTIVDYFKEAFPPELEGSIGRSYLARVFLGPSHLVHRRRATLMRDFLRGLGLGVTKAVVPARQAAARAGLTTFGRNNFAFAKDSGSYVAISTFVVDAALDYDAPVFAAPCPKDCRLCLEACPTGALYEPFKMNPHQCIAFRSYAVTGPTYGQVSEALPVAIREQMGRWIYGCDACQDACPRNKPKLKAKLPPDQYVARMSPALTPTALLNMSDEHFSSRVLPVLYYIKEKKYLQRNAAVALGNIGNPEAVPALTLALADAEPLVRSHAAWALGKIGGSRAVEALDTALGRETSPEARNEIALALSFC